MKIDFNSKVADKLAVLGKVVDPKPLMEIMGNLLLRTENGMLCVSAANQECTMTVFIEPTEFSEMNNICVNANDFHSALFRLKGEIEFVLNPEKKLLRCVYNGGFFQLPYTDDPVASDVLKIRHDKYNIETDITDTYTFCEAVTKAQIAAAASSVKPVLCGVYFDLKADGMVVVSCDAHRMSVYKTGITFSEDIKGFILYRKYASMVVSLVSGCESESVNMKVNDNNVLFRTDDFECSVRLTEGEYPNYTDLIPRDNPFCAKVNKDRFIDAIRRVLPMEDKNQMLVLDFSPNTLVVETEDVFYKKKAKEKIECEYSGEAMRIGVKSMNIISLVQPIDSEEVEIHFKTPRNPLVFLPTSELKDRFLTFSVAML